MHNPSQTKQSRQTQRVPSTATALVSGTVSTTPSCCYYQQAHPSNNCKVVTLVEERKQQALSAPSNTSSVPSLELSNEPTINNPRQGLNSRATAFDVQPSTTLHFCDTYNPQSTLTVRVVLDSGSQHSYITKRMREARTRKSETKAWS